MTASYETGASEDESRAVGVGRRALPVIATGVNPYNLWTSGARSALRIMDGLRGQEQIATTVLRNR